VGPSTARSHSAVEHSDESSTPNLRFRLVELAEPFIGFIVVADEELIDELVVTDKFDSYQFSDLDSRFLFVLSSVKDSHQDAQFSLLCEQIFLAHHY
jgi:hypothetical protein